MTETPLVAAWLKLARAELPNFVFQKHADRFTSGTPDVSVTGHRKTSWIEFKHGEKIVWANGLQQLTCRRLAIAGTCWVVLYKDLRGVKRTLIMTPEERIETWTEGFDHRFVLDFVRKVHSA